MESFSELRNRFRTAWSSYPKGFMGLILIAWAIPAIYTLTNTYFIGRMEMEAIAISEQYETVGVLLEILLEMFPLAVLALVARNLTDATKVMRVVKSAALMQLAVTVAFMAFIMAGTGLLVDCINTPEEIRERTISFLQIKALAMLTPLDGIPFRFPVLKAGNESGIWILSMDQHGVIHGIIVEAAFERQHFRNFFRVIPVAVDQTV